VGERDEGRTEEEWGRGMRGGPRRSGGEGGGEDQEGVGEREEGRTKEEWGKREKQGEREEG